MPTNVWNGLGLASLTAISSTNINQAGNGDLTLTYIATSGGAIRTTIQDTGHGNGIAVTGNVAGAAARLDTPLIAGGAPLFAIQFILKAPTSITVASHYYCLGRNVNATVASTGNVVQNTALQVEIRNAGDSNTTSAIAGVSSTTGRTPALVGNDYYQIDAAIILNTFATPSITNGRFILRVRALSAPGVWNSGTEFWFDTGYTANATTDNTGLFRLIKAIAADATADFEMLEITVRNSTTVDTGTNGTAITKANSITNFVQALSPTVDSTGTGATYLIRQVATPASGDTSVSYVISQTAGPTHTPVVRNPDGSTTAKGVWSVVQDTASSCTYHIDVTSNPSGGTAAVDVVVPPAAVSSTGVYQRRIRISGAWVG